MLKILIPVQERVTLAQAECRYQAIYCFADRTAASPQRSEIFSSGDSHVFAAGLKQVKPAELAPNLRDGCFWPDTLQNFAEDQVC